MADIGDLLTAKGLGRIAEVVKKAVKPSVWLWATKPSEAATSRLGGRPNLPADLDWPMWYDEPLPFVAQFQLDAIPEMQGFPLPREGALFFFHEAGWNDGWDGLAVIFSPTRLTESPLRDFPDDLEDDFCFSGYDLEVRATGPSIPDFTDQVLEEQGITDEECMTYQDVSWSWEPQPGFQGHRTGGYPDCVQRQDPKLEVHLASLGLDPFTNSASERRKVEKAKAGAKDWELLFQLDSEKKAGMMWYDAGRIYFLIHKDDLAARRFDQVWSVMQTS
jgi:uncharacterized protein YwqG